MVQKKELILTMEDNVDSENLLKIFLETQVKEEKEQDGLIGIIAEKVSEESCTEQCESCQKYCPDVYKRQANMRVFADDNSYPLLSSLEILAEDGTLERKADMFSKRTIKAHEAVTSVDTASEAL